MSAVPGKAAADHAVQKYEETDSEGISRQAAEFPKFEELINFKRFSRWNLRTIDSATGLLGLKNPFGRKASASDHEVWLFDNTAYRVRSTSSGPARWEAEFVACFFHKGRENVTKAVSYIADAIGVDGKTGVDDEARALIAARVGPFVSAIAPARTIAVKIPSKTESGQRCKLGPSDSNGISNQVVSIENDTLTDGSIITTVNDGADYPPVSGKTYFAAPEGWMVISDIDDTIKVTLTPDPAGILRTTFAEEPRITQGMPAFYKTLHKQFAPAFYYLSASPYNLYPFLRQFIAEHYPHGTILLRDASWMFFGGILQSLTQGVQAYKVDRMDRIHERLPERKVICVGDSTQKDPESYAEIYAKYPGWVKAIYIRKVLDAPFMDEKNTDERFQKAFANVPSHVWKIFVNPDELTDHLRQLA